MTEFLKKAGLNFWMGAVGSLLAFVGAILFIVTNASVGYEVSLGGLGVAFGIIAFLLMAGATYLGTRMGNKHFVVAAMNLIAMVLLTVVIGLLLLSRVDLASGLFTWESSNLVGWSVFTTSVVAIVFLLLAVIVLIVGAFLGKERRD